MQDFKEFVEYLLMGLYLFNWLCAFSMLGDSILQSDKKWHIILVIISVIFKIYYDLRDDKKDKEKQK